MESIHDVAGCLSKNLNYAVSSLDDKIVIVSKGDKRLALTSTMLDRVFHLIDLSSDSRDTIEFFNAIKEGLSITDMWPRSEYLDKFRYASINDIIPTVDEMLNK